MKFSDLQTHFENHMKQSAAMQHRFTLNSQNDKGAIDDAQSSDYHSVVNANEHFVSSQSYYKGLFLKNNQTSRLDSSEEGYSQRSNIYKAYNEPSEQFVRITENDEDALGETLQEEKRKVPDVQSLALSPRQNFSSNRQFRSPQSVLTESQNQRNLVASPYSSEKIGGTKQIVEGQYRSNSSNRYNNSKENDDDLDGCCEMPEKYVPLPMNPSASQYALQKYNKLSAQSPSLSENQFARDLETPIKSEPSQSGLQKKKFIVNYTQSKDQIKLVQNSSSLGTVSPLKSNGQHTLFSYGRSSVQYANKSNSRQESSYMKLGKDSNNPHLKQGDSSSVGIETSKHTFLSCLEANEKNNTPSFHSGVESEPSAIVNKIEFKKYSSPQANTTQGTASFPNQTFAIELHQVKHPDDIESQTESIQDQNNEEVDQELDVYDESFSQCVDALIQNLHAFPLQQQTMVEELILQLHQLTMQGDGQIPRLFKSQIMELKDVLMASIEEKEFIAMNQDQASLVLEQYQKVIPPFMKQAIDKVKHFLPQFQNVFEQYSLSATQINSKNLQAFKSQTKPAKLELNIGLGFMILFASIDSSEIKLTNDKRQLADKNWNQSVIKYFKNCGRIVQNIRKIKEFLDHDQIPAPHIAELRNYINDPRITQSEVDKIGSISQDLLQYLKAVILYYDFLTFVKDHLSSNCQREQNFYEKYLQAKSVSSRDQGSKCLSSQKTDPDAPKSACTMTPSLPQSKRLTEVTPQYDAFKVNLNAQLYDDNLQSERALADQQAQMDQAKKTIIELKKKELQIKWNMERKQVKAKKEIEKQEKLSYMAYQQELRKRFQEFMKEKIRAEKLSDLEINRDKVFDQRIRKIRESAEYKLYIIDEFRKTLENIDYKERLKEEVKVVRDAHHIEFVESLKQDKLFRQELYMATRLAEHEDRKDKRKTELNFEHQKLLKEQQDILHSLELLQKCM